MDSPEKTKPDVEAIIADISKHIQSVEPPETLSAEALTLYEELQEAGKTYSGGYLPSGGLTAIMRKIIYRMLGLKEFNGRMIRILCRIVALLEGAEVPESSLVLTRQKNTMDLLIELSERLADLDKLHIEKRLAALEAEVAALKTAAGS